MSGMGLCAVCCREVAVRNDGRLKAHLAATSRAGNREQCDGSGSFTARDDLIPGTAGREQGRPLISRSAAFNAREEWFKVDALYTEYLDMCEVGAASYESMVAARDAVQRAVSGARALAPWWLASAYADGPDAA